MEQYSLQQRIQIIKTHYRNYKNIDDTCREVGALFNQPEAPSQQIILSLVKQFESVGHVGLVGDANTPVRTGKVKPAKSITNVIERLAENKAERANDVVSISPPDDQQRASSPVGGSPSIAKNISNNVEVNAPCTILRSVEDDPASKDNSKSPLKTKSPNSAPKSTRKAKRPRHR